MGLSSASLARVLLASLFLVGCGPSACERSCEAYGITDPARCDELCNGDCQELAEIYGLGVERCQAVQAGTP